MSSPLLYAVLLISSLVPASAFGLPNGTQLIRPDAIEFPKNLSTVPFTTTVFPTSIPTQTATTDTESRKFVGSPPFIALVALGAAIMILLAITGLFYLHSRSRSRQISSMLEKAAIAFEDDPFEPHSPVTPITAASYHYKKRLSGDSYDPPTLLSRSPEPSTHGEESCSDQDDGK